MNLPLITAMVSALGIWEKFCNIAFQFHSGNHNGQALALSFVQKATESQPSFLPSFLPALLPSFVPSFLSSFLPSFLSSFLFFLSLFMSMLFCCCIFLLLMLCCLFDASPVSNPWVVRVPNHPEGRCLGWSPSCRHL